MIDATELRIQVRTVLSSRPADETMAEEHVFLALEKFFGKGRVTVAAMMLALAWNEARGWAEKRRNADWERDEWKLTEKGRVKEGL